MRKDLVLLVIVTSVVAAGCMSSRYAYYERQRPEPADTLAMTKEDVIALSKEGIGDDVIIEQIRATNSSFELSKDDIIELKNAGVSEEVIRAMIRTSEKDRPRRIVREYYWSPYFYGYPWSPTFWWGFSYRYYRPYYDYIAPRVHYFYHGSAGGGSRSSGRTRR